ncbi:periplasmic Cu(I)/Cu(II)-binding protein CopK [Ramlibacter sp. RBP-2]|uniref:Periplasmic Cu(I)/Cu(II)-binding protein CopK n=1 Tax=Ramlibacter lithotrophicus TaxID=2606681 RepID=A0A7X6I7M8_9BURK|nr:periplasmic Cu(I)/Cu(II)-binding protein CopK [Ramlibacter lithotrophicus]NKE67568.1 periplasmic Cu(I)/Cu(II)-binding protein CopK [Ramlibacter lithotrophicus]
MLKVIATAAAVLFSANVALAADKANVDKSIPLKDGSTVYIFKDGKMAMEDKLGRVVPMKPGHVMQTKDGQSILMVGNELARLDWIRKSDLGGK